MPGGGRVSLRPRSRTMAGCTATRTRTWCSAKRLRRNIRAPCARSASIRACCRTRPGTRDLLNYDVVPAKAGTQNHRPRLRARRPPQRPKDSPRRMGPDLRQDDDIIFIILDLLRRLLRHRRRGARDRGPAHVARLRLIVTADPVHGLAIVPHHEIMHGPSVHMDELRLGGML